MANSLNINVSVNGTINNSGVGPVNGNTQYTPAGNNFYDQSLTIPPNVWTSVATGSSFGTASVIFLGNSSTTSSISFTLSASGVANNFGTIPAVTGTNNSATLIQWNGLFTNLYAYTTPSASAALVTIVNQ